MWCCCAAASEQFAGNRTIILRVTKVDRETYYGRVWLSGYELDRKGAAVERRDVFVQIAGLRVPCQIADRTR